MDSGRAVVAESSAPARGWSFYIEEGIEAQGANWSSVASGQRSILWLYYHHRCRTTVWDPQRGGGAGDGVTASWSECSRRRS